MKKIFYGIEEGKLRIIETNNEEYIPPKGWKETDDENLYRYAGEPIECFDKDMNYIGKEIKKPVKWYNKKTMSPVEISDEPTEDFLAYYTKDAPLNESYQFFDSEQNKWVVDEEKKDRAEKEAELARLKADIAEAERKQIRPLKEIVRGKATDDDQKVFMENEDIILSLRPHVAELEEELKNA